MSADIDPRLNICDVWTAMLRRGGWESRDEAVVVSSLLYKWITL
jgi:hypothetical protein